MSHALEEKKKALLERMRAKRANYRYTLAGEDEHGSHTQAFPRSHTFKFLTRHPYAAALAAGVALAALPRGLLSRTVKGGVALTAGILSAKVKDMTMRHLLPSMVHLLRSRKRLP